jgi:AcrR family transcriptional regulator
MAHNVPRRRALPDDREAGDSAGDEEAATFVGLSDEARVERMLAGELGDEMASALAVARELQERWELRRRPNDGLREHKKRRTRQQISDVATALFVTRGFDQVKVSEVADLVGVSEKTVYNYFPTKESLVFDRTDETLERIVDALRKRETGESPTRAVVRALDEDMEDLEQLPDGLYPYLALFDAMVASTPSLRAAWVELNRRMVEVATDELAALADVDPRDPEPMIAGRAIGALHELAATSRLRRMESGLRGADLRGAVLADLERAARLLDAGLWSFNLLTQGARTHEQIRESAQAAEEARRQVLAALKHARTAWHELRKLQRKDLRRDRAKRTDRSASRRSSQTS